MHDATPFISVIIPTYNRWPMVTEAVDSTLAQTEGPIEVIVVDDGSTDGTAGHLESERPSVTVIRQENSERGVARNTGLRAATGRFVVFLDADDILEPWYVSQVIQRWRRCGHSDRLYLCETRRWWPETGVIEDRPLGLDGEKSVWRRSLRGTIGNASIAAVPRSAALAVGGFPEERACAGSEDWVFQVRVIATGLPIEILPRPAVRVREHPGRSMNDDRAREASRQAALRILLDGQVADRRLDAAEQTRAIAGTHRFCAAHSYRSGRMRDARRHLREVRRQLGLREAISWSGRLWLQTWLGARLSTTVRSFRERSLYTERGDSI